MKHLIIGLFCLGSVNLNAQLPNGSIAPDFTLTDLDGNSHHLYDYLNAGKTVYLDFFACHCPFCWAYEQTGYMSTLYEQYGPSGTNEVMVLGLELDVNNGFNEFNGVSGNTQGNWVAAASFPLVNPEGSELTQLVSDWDATFYPLIYAICPDGKVTYIGKQTTENLYGHVASCASALELTEKNQGLSFFYSSETQQLISSIPLNGKLSLIGLDGKQVFDLTFQDVTALNLPEDLTHGFYILRINSGEQTSQQRILIY